MPSFAAPPPSSSPSLRPGPSRCLRLTAGAALAFCSGVTLAQDVSDIGTLSEVVVTASGFEQELKEAPASISVITREDLETRQFRDLGEALQGVEGIDVMGSTGPSRRPPGPRVTPASVRRASSKPPIPCWTPSW